MRVLLAETLRPDAESVSVVEYGSGKAFVVRTPPDMGLYADMGAAGICVQDKLNPYLWYLVKVECPKELVEAIA